SGVLTSYFFFGSDILLPFDLQDDFIVNDIPYFMLLGIVAAGVSIYFTKVYASIQYFFDRINGPIKRLFIGGVAIGVIVFLVPPLYGEGYELMNNMVQGNPTAALKNNILNIDLSNIWGVIILLVGLLLFKIVASAITFGAGGVGGIFAPTLFMGCIMGNCLAKVLNNIGILQSPVSESNFTLVGMTGLMAGVLHAPLTAIFLIAELTGGYELFLPLMITATISYAITKYFVPYSVYTMELAKKGELITHNKDKAVLTLMDMETVIETNFVPVYPDMTLGEIINQAVVKSN